MRNSALALALGLLSATANAQSIPAYEKVALDAKVFFDSDRWTLRPAGRDALDDFVLRMHGLESQTVRVVGFADHIGSEASNQVLAEERASAVKAYLVMKGIAADRVRTSASLRPDRRVLVEVSGTRIAQ
ncbi:MAG TPA: OmpA family protein [Burkholderiales bacterium]|nr:OmpA family protein [Burkholderiales bacterium]